MGRPHRVSLGAVQVLSRGCMPLYPRCCWRLYSRTAFQEGDVVALSNKPLSAANSNIIISNPLVPDGMNPVGGKRMRGRLARVADSIAMNDIIGKGQREYVKSVKGDRYMLHEPTLAEYVTHSARVVTPIYPQDANLIVSLLDLHPSAPGTDNGTDDQILELFEAGTGHGSLTLHLARAIHGANAPAPTVPPTDDTISSESEGEDAYKFWRATRRAVIHSLDNSPAHSAHARNVVRNFRRGMYSPNVDFHVGGIVDYLSLRLESNNQDSFLTHAILDLPEPSLYLEILGKALNPFGKLVTFSPSVTQTVRCLEIVEEQSLPFMLEKVIEVGAGFGSGGREWDIRSVLPRSRRQNMSLGEKASTNHSEETVTEEVGVESAEAAGGSEESGVESFCDKSKEGQEMVCRPKVGLRIEGGGFIGLWRRKYFKGQDAPEIEIP